jgi:alpha-mannosidase
MREWPVYPSLRFGTFADFFRAAETVRDKLPVFDREINFFAAGCYTTQSRIKLANRRTEAALLDAEFLDSMSASLTGKRYPPEKLEQAWQKTLFNHFHDILTGSCVRDSREYAMANFAAAQAVAGTAREKAGAALAAAIDTSMFAGAEEGMDDRGNRSEGAGAGFGLENFGGIPSPERGQGSLRLYHVFNPSANKRRELLEFTLWDWDYDLGRMELIDHAGKALPVQLLDEEPVTYWDHRYVRFLAQVELPAGGYASFALREKEFGVEHPHLFLTFPRTDTIHGPVVLENEHLRAEFDSASGALRSLTDKKTGKEKIVSGKSAGLVINWAEKQTNDAWMTGRYLAQEAVNRTVRLKPNAGQTLRKGFEMEQVVLGSRITTSVSLDAGAKALSYRFKIDWNEAAKDHDNVPVLCFALPLQTAPDCYQSDVPAGIQKRPGGCHDIPGLQYMAAVKGAEATALVSDCKYGYRGYENILYATLINTASSPDPYPERGEHVIRLWVVLEESEPKALHDAAFALCHPPSIVSGSVHSGNLSPEKELLRLDSASTVLCSCAASGGGLLVRLCETSGKTDAIRLTFPFEIASARFVDLDGKDITSENHQEMLSPRGNSLNLQMPPCKIRGLLIKC